MSDQDVSLFSKREIFLMLHAHTVPLSASQEEADAEILDCTALKLPWMACCGPRFRTNLYIHSVATSLQIWPCNFSGNAQCRQYGGITALNMAEPPVVTIIWKRKILRLLPKQHGFTVVYVNTDLTLQQRRV